MGAIVVPGEGEIILPAVGIGARFQKNSRGIDFSFNSGSLLFFNYLSLKSVFLFYPYWEKHHQFYCGIGAGIGYSLNAVPLIHASDKTGSLNLEGILGFEFRHYRHFKTFIQLELSQPLISLTNFSEHPYTPGVAVYIGMGF